MQRGQSSIPPRFPRPPVAIGPDQSATQLFSMLAESQLYSAGAGGLGRKMASAAPIPMALRVVPRSNPNSPSSQQTLKPVERTQFKQGYTTTVFPNASN